MQKYTLSDRNLCDIELLLNGGFAPLTGFMNQLDYDSVVTSMRLTDGSVWPMPINLDVTSSVAESWSVGDVVLLQDKESLPIAELTIESLWEPDKTLECQSIFGSTDTAHPGVNYVLNYAGNVYVGGSLKQINLPKHYDFNHLRATPSAIKQYLADNKITKLVGFQTRNPMHRAHQELTLRAAQSVGASVLIHPVVGMTKPGDIDYVTRVRCYQLLLQHYPEGQAMLSLLPLAMRMAGPREALWHALIRKNYGCTHFIVGRDHAGPGKDSQGNDFYGPYDAQELVKSYESEIGIEMVPFQEMVFVKETQQYSPVSDLTEDQTPLRISGTEFRHRLRTDQSIPSWFSYPVIIDELRQSYPAKDKQGFTLFFTGLSGSGKSTIANALLIRLRELTHRTITLLDGDIVRTHLSSELGFSKEHRDLNIQRIGYVASEITKHRGIAICAPIAPYASTRARVKELVQPSGGFIEIHVSTSLDVCESRDPKGLYKKARAGEIKQFTGIDDPYENPEDADLVLDTEKLTVENSVNTIMQFLAESEYLMNVTLSSQSLPCAEETVEVE